MFGAAPGRSSKKLERGGLPLAALRLTLEKNMAIANRPFVGPMAQVREESLSVHVVDRYNKHGTSPQKKKEHGTEDGKT